MLDKKSRKIRWTRNGAALGLALAALEAVGIWGDGYMAWEGIGIAVNFGAIVGTIIGTTFLFLLAAAVTDVFAKDQT